VREREREREEAKNNQFSSSLVTRADTHFTSLISLHLISISFLMVTSKGRFMSLEVMTEAKD
jgi:hypothetical protein